MKLYRNLPGSLFASFLLFLVMCLILLAPAAKADTTSISNLLGTVSAPSQPTNTLQDAEKLVVDGYNEIKSLSWTNGFDAEVFGIYHRGDYGAGLAVSTMNTNSINYGFAMAAMYQTETASTALGTISKRKLDFYDANFSLQYTRTEDVAVIGNVTWYASTAAAINLDNVKGGPFNETITGLKKTFTVNSNIQISVGGGIGYSQEWNSSFYIATVGFIDHLQGKHFFGLF